MRAQQVLKACACLVDERGRLLVFFHPGDAGMQLRVIDTVRSALAP